MKREKKIKVLIVDDSALVRKLLGDIFSSDVDIEVIGSAGNPYLAANIIKKQLPDLVTLDIEMPRMDGLTFLKILMSQLKIPTIIISSLSERNSETELKALELGAFEVVQKPTIKALKNSEDLQRRSLLELVKSAAFSKVSDRRNKDQKEGKSSLKSSSKQRSSMIKTTNSITVIGSSTGGTEALTKILTALPYDCPALAIVQHMPEKFTKLFAERLDSICDIRVKEAENGEPLLKGQALIAPGNRHMAIKRSGARYIVDIFDAETVNRHRPSVDVLFDSAAKYVGRNCRGLILTGMGKDGAKGLYNLKEAGAETIAQNEETCVVFGMPKEAIRLGGAKNILSLDKIASYLF